jgi:DNA-binding response OmpR family regulator
VSESREQILIVDDEEPVRRLLRKCLEKQNYTIFEAANGEEMERVLATENIQLVTLDITLDDEDGLDLARSIRAKSNLPIIMVSGKGELIDKVVGLEIGADDYISKPFELREVVARVRAVLRRYSEDNEAPVDGSTTYRFDGWKLDCGRRELHGPDDSAVHLTSGEFDLLQLFVTHAQQVLSRDQIMDLLKGNEWTPNDRTIDNQVTRLRKKLDGRSELIKTVRGVGYIFSADVQR